jgi:DNA-binding NtrC family response regulator
LEGLLVDARNSLAGFPRVPIDEVINQQADVLFSFSKSRYPNREDIQAVKQIATEQPSADSSLKVTVRGRGHPNVSANRARPADTFKLMLLQNAQEGNLGFGWKFSDFVQEERTAVSRQASGRKGESQANLLEKVAAQERELIEAALRECQGRVYGPAGAAAKLGIARSTLESKIQSLKINKNRFKA